MRDLSGVQELGTPGVRQATEAALGGVQAATLLSSAVAGAQDVSTGTSTPRPLAPRVPLTKLLGRRGLTRAAAAGVPAAQLCLYRLHLRRRRLRLLHPSRHRHRCLHLHRCHRSPHLCHHPHPHPLLRLHRHYCRPHYLLQLLCPACPC
ncbi:unnamed protein product [Closterium sp. NIES-53]